MMNKLLLTTSAALLLSAGASPAQQPPDVKVETKVIERSRPGRPEQGSSRRAMDEQRAARDMQQFMLDKQQAEFAELHGGGPEGWWMAPGFPRSGGSRALLLADQPPTDEAHKSAQEDAAVMLRLLEKATRDDRRDDPMRAMGIHIEALSGRQGPQAVYLGGFGALFLLNVDYPLLAPPAGGSEPKPKAEGESEWERTRREMFDGHGRRGGPQPPRGPESQPFDPNRVERLKSALIDALANAANLRQVANGEAVVVSVTGPGNAAGGKVRVYSNSGGGGGAGGGDTGVRSETRVEVFEHEVSPGAEAGGGRGPGPRQTQLTLKALRSDIDAFAKKEITRDAFAQRVKVVAF